MNADELQQAAAHIRSDWPDRQFERSVADWLDLTASQMPKLGPLFNKSPQVTQAFTVARAYRVAP